MKRPKLPTLNKLQPGRALNTKLSFSLEWMTRNKSYSFSGFDRKRMREELNARQALSGLLSLLSGSTWSEVFARRREELGGTEQIRYRELAFEANMVELPSDTNALSFRFGGGKYRALGIKMPNDNRLYLIGYDFDFSAYHHG